MRRFFGLCAVLFALLILFSGQGQPGNPSRGSAEGAVAAPYGREVGPYLRRYRSLFRLAGNNMHGGIYAPSISSVTADAVTDISITSRHNYQPRLRCNTSATANNVCNATWDAQQVVAGGLPWSVYWRWLVGSTSASATSYSGMQADVDPSPASIVAASCTGGPNVRRIAMYVRCDSFIGTLQVCSNDGDASPTCATPSPATGFRCDPQAVFDITMNYDPVNVAVGWRVQNMDTGVEDTGSLVGDLPDAGAILSMAASECTGEQTAAARTTVVFFEVTQR